ncbi:MAG TPA: hypothetical protein VE571_06500, partial [Solirubrobacteraceae bacterium]|nr:hypothetical protein [Solirubrobacteraceae bacterium]
DIDIPSSDWMSPLGPSMIASWGDGVGLRGLAARAGVGAAATAPASAHRQRRTSALRRAAPVQSVERAEPMTLARTSEPAAGCAAHVGLTEI